MYWIVMHSIRSFSFFIHYNDDIGDEMNRIFSGSVRKIFSRLSAFERVTLGKANQLVRIWLEYLDFLLL
jgi:hypothetical protein